MLRNVDINGISSVIPSGGKMVMRNHPFKVTFWKNKQGLEHLSFLFSTKAEMSVLSTHGYEAEVHREDDETTELILKRSEFDEDSGLFFTLVEDLICIGDSCADLSQQECAKAVERRIVAWHRFMKAEGKTLSPQKELGLFGELVILREWLRRGGLASAFSTVWTGPVHGARDFTFPNGEAMEVKTSLSDKALRVTIDSLEGLASAFSTVWTGPVHGARDFTFPNGEAMEVKTSLSDKALRVTIDSLEQLSTADFPHLSLVTVQVQVDEEGISLIDLYEEICTLLKHSTLKLEFESLLVSLGFHPHNPGFDVRTFAVGAMRSFKAEEICTLLKHSTLKLEFESLLVSLGFHPHNPGFDVRTFAVGAMRSFKASSLPRLLLGQIPGIVKAKYDIVLVDEEQALGDKICEEVFEDRLTYLTQIVKDE